jgi:hypothetical protein
MRHVWSAAVRTVGADGAVPWSRARRHVGHGAHVWGSAAQGYLLRERGAAVGLRRLA